MLQEDPPELLQVDPKGRLIQTVKHKHLSLYLYICVSGV